MKLSNGIYSRERRLRERVYLFEFLRIARRHVPALLPTVATNKRENKGNKSCLQKYKCSGKLNSLEDKQDMLHEAAAFKATTGRNKGQKSLTKEQ